MQDVPGVVPDVAGAPPVRDQSRDDEPVHRGLQDVLDARAGDHAVL